MKDISNSNRIIISFFSLLPTSIMIHVSTCPSVESLACVIINNAIILYLINNSKSQIFPLYLRIRGCFYVHAIYLYIWAIKMLGSRLTKLKVP